MNWSNLASSSISENNEGKPVANEKKMLQSPKG